MDQNKQTSAQGCGSCSQEAASREKPINVFDEIAKMTDHLDGIGEEEVLRIVHETFKD